MSSEIDPPYLRARRLLLSHLTPQQTNSLRTQGGFIVEAPSGALYWLGDAYVKRLATAGEACWESNGPRYCIEVFDDDGHYLPSDDSLLAIKLLIQGDEKKFLRTAHVVGGRRRSLCGQFVTSVLIPIGGGLLLGYVLSASVHWW
jgi:hypothetical protein